ncbi:MAG: hypothetical protein ACI4JB_05395 [Porcipelethomonas sp.]
MDNTVTEQQEKPKNPEEQRELQEKKTETPEVTGETEQLSGDPPEDMIEMVRAKHSEEPKRERIADILTMQLILCILLVLVFAVINIIDKDIAQQFIGEFKKQTAGETEQIIKDAVSYAAGLLR